MKLTNGLTVTKGGEVFYGKNKEYISDCVGDADTDLLRCILPHVSDPNNMFGHLFMDDLMAAAGYSQAALNNYFSKLGENDEPIYKNKKCTIRKGTLYVKPTTRGRKKQND